MAKSFHAQRSPRAFRQRATTTSQRKPSQQLRIGFQLSMFYRGFCRIPTRAPVRVQGLQVPGFAF